MVIIDAVRSDDLVEIGVALRDRKLLCAGSGIALGLPANFACVPRKIPWRGAGGETSGVFKVIRPLDSRPHYQADDRAG